MGSRHRIRTMCTISPATPGLLTRRCQQLDKRLVSIPTAAGYMLSGAPSLRLAVRPLPTRCSSPNPHSRESCTARPVGRHDRSLPGEGLPLPLILALGPAFLKYGGRLSPFSGVCGAGPASLRPSVCSSSTGTSRLLAQPPDKTSLCREPHKAPTGGTRLGAPPLSGDRKLHRRLRRRDLCACARSSPGSERSWCPTGRAVRDSRLCGLGLEHLVGSGRTAKRRLGAPDNIYPAAVGIDTSLLSSCWHWRVSRPGVAGDIVHIVLIRCRDPIRSAYGVHLVARVACNKTGARRRHGRQSSCPSVRLRVVHIDFVCNARSGGGACTSPKDVYLASVRHRSQVRTRVWQRRNGAPGICVNVVLFYCPRVGSPAAWATGTLPASNDEDAVVNHRSGRPCAGRGHRGEGCPRIRHWVVALKI